MSIGCGPLDINKIWKNKPNRMFIRCGLLDINKIWKNGQGNGLNKDVYKIWTRHSDIHLIDIAF